MLAIPADGQLDASREIVLRIIAEMLSGLCDISVRIMDIASARSIEQRLDLHAECLADVPVDFNQVLPPASSDIICRACRFFRGETGTEVPFHDVCDIGEIP